MFRRVTLLWCVGALAVGGCASPDRGVPLLTPASGPVAASRTSSSSSLRTHRDQLPGPIQRASFQKPEVPVVPESAITQAPSTATIDDLVQYALSKNPRLARATLGIDAARGRYLQAGLYPNPVLAVTGDELGDRQGPAGIITAPQVTQEIVTGGRLRLSQAVAAREVDQATLTLLAERYAVIGSVRAAFYEVYALERRLEILTELVRLSEQAVAQGRTAVENKQMARIDLVPLEVEFERFRADLEALERELPSARGRLSAVTGDPRMKVVTLTAPFDLPPAYDYERSREVVMASHPEVRSAVVGVERAQAALRRAEVEPIPNLSVSTGYTRQNQNKSNDWLLGVSAPVPLWNRNQGNIREAQANVGIAIQDVLRAENDVAERLSVAFRTYAAARRRGERYQTQIVPRAEESFDLAMKAFKGGQFEYLRVIQAQRAAAEARLELNRSLGEAWRAAAELSALLLEEMWPGRPPGPGAGPAMLPLPKGP